MHSAAIGYRTYDPTALNTMSWAFEAAFSGLSLQSRRGPNVRRDLAVCVFRLFDEGETIPLRLSRLALANITNPPRTRRDRFKKAFAISALIPAGSCGRTPRRPATN